MAILPSGKLLVGGDSCRGRPHPFCVVLATRLLKSGPVDRAFATNGRASSSHRGGETAAALAEGLHGKVVIAGERVSARCRRKCAGDFSVIRFLGT